MQNYTEQALAYLSDGDQRTPAPGPATKRAAGTATRAAAPKKARSQLKGAVRGGELMVPRKGETAYVIDSAAVGHLARALHVPVETVLTVSAINRRTFQRRSKEKAELTQTESDRVLRIARVAAEAKRVFGDNDKSTRWLNTHSVVLGGKPLDLLATDAGSRAVEDELGRIEYGVFG